MQRRTINQAVGESFPAATNHHYNKEVRHMPRTMKFVVAFLAAIILSIATVSVASADTLTVTPPTFSSTASASEVGVLQVKTKYKHVGTYIAVSKSKVNLKKCHWTKKGEKWTNSTNLDASKFSWYQETTPAKLCALKKPIRKGGRLWRQVKVAGGKTGQPCYNLADDDEEQPKPKFKGSFMDYRNLQYDVSFELKGSATATATATCIGAGGSASASANGSGSYATVIRVRVRSKSKSKAVSTAKGKISLKQYQSVKIMAEGRARFDLNAKATVSCPGAKPPTTCEDRGDCPIPEKSVLITSWTEMNDIPVGKSSDNFHIGVYASDEGGSLTIDPGVGGVGPCGSTQSVTVTYVVPLQKGSNDVCVTLFAPQDASASSMTVTVTATLGNKSDTKSQTFLITHPTRPE